MKNNAIKVALLMSKLNVAAKINKSRLILEAISVNIGTFVTPSPDLTVVQAAIDDLETAWNEAAGGGKTKTAIMHDKEADLLKLMIDLANYVQFVANGDESIIHLAALDVKKPPSKTQNDFEAIRGNDSGTVLVRVKAIRGAYYIYQFSTDPSNEGSWVEAGKTNKSKLLVTDLTPLTTYWFRVAVLDNKGEHPFNTPLSVVVI